MKQNNQKSDIEKREWRYMTTTNKEIPQNRAEWLRESIKESMLRPKQAWKNMANVTEDEEARAFYKACGIVMEALAGFAKHHAELCCSLAKDETPARAAELRQWRTTWTSLQHTRRKPFAKLSWLSG